MREAKTSIEGLNRSSFTAYLKTRGSSITCSGSDDLIDDSVSSLDDDGSDAGAGDDREDRIENSISSLDDAPGSGAGGVPVDQEPWL